MKKQLVDSNSFDQFLDDLSLGEKAILYGSILLQLNSISPSNRARIENLYKLMGGEKTLDEKTMIECIRLLKNKGMSAIYKGYNVWDDSNTHLEKVQIIATRPEYQIIKEYVQTQRDQIGVGQRLVYHYRANMALDFFDPHAKLDEKFFSIFLLTMDQESFYLKFLEEVMPETPDQAILDKLPQEKRNFVLRACLCNVVHIADTIYTYLPVVNKSFSLAKLHEFDSEILFYYAQFFFLTGELKKVAKVAEHMEDHHRLFTLGVLSMMEDDYDGARARFEEALKNWKHTTKSKKLPLCNVFGVLYVFALMDKYEVNYLKHTPRISIPVRSMFAETFEDIDVYDFLFDFKKQADSCYVSFDSLPSVILAGWVQKFTEKNVEFEHHSWQTLKSFVGPLTTLGFKWLVGEILEHPLHQSSGKATVKRPDVKLLPIHLSSYASKPKWEMWLEAMETTDLKTEVASKVRLIWMVDLESDEVWATEQKLSKKGTWSKGRKISINSIWTGEYNFDNPRDEELKLTIVNDDYWSGGLHFNFGKAIKRLVGRDNVYLNDKFITPLNIIYRDPVLFIKRLENGSYLLTVQPDRHLGIPLGRKSYDVLEVFHISKTHASIIEVVSQIRESFPSDAHSRLVEWLKQVKDHIQISGDIPAELYSDTPSVDGDPRLLVKIIPQKDGSFMGEIFVQPILDVPIMEEPGIGFPSMITELSGETVLLVRDFEKELENFRALKDLADTQGFELMEEIWCIEFNSELRMLEFLESAQDLVKNDHIRLEILKDHNNKILKFIKSQMVNLKLDAKSNWLNAEVDDIPIDEGLSIKFKDLLEFTKQEESNFYAINDKDFVLISAGLRRKIKQLALISDYQDEGFEVHPLMANYLEHWADDGGMQVKKSSGWKKTVNKVKEKEQEEFELPTGLKAELRPYQIEGFQWLCRRAEQGLGACLADDMGLGKTLQSIAVLLKRASLGPALVVAPTSVCSNWQAELTKFAPELEVFNFYEEDREKVLENQGPGQVLICSYGLVANLIDQLSQITFASAILDEAQAIKNPTTQRAKAVFKLNALAKWVCTGTPIENRLQELWSIFRFLNPGFLGSIKQFNNRFATPIEQHGDEFVAEQLRTIVSPFLMRRTKSQVLTDLPEKSEVDRLVILSKAELTFYESIRRKAKEEMEAAEGLSPGERMIKVLTTLTKLRLAACNASLVAPDVDLESFKMNALDDLLSEILPGGHQVLIFSQFVKHLDLIKEFLDQKKITYFSLDGSTSPKKRKEMIAAFEGGAAPVFLLSLKAGGTGINLTSASYVIHMDPWWNPAVEDQATDRAHRIGQTKAVTVYRMISKMTIEEKIINLHSAKRALADQIIGEQMISNLDIDTLMKLVMEE